MVWKEFNHETDPFLIGLIVLLLLIVRPSPEPLRAQDQILDPATLPYVAAYRLVATTDATAAERSGASYTPNSISLAGMSPDGSVLAWVAVDRSGSTLYVSDFEGTQIASGSFPQDAGAIWELEVSNGGIFIRTSLGHIWYAGTDGGVSPWFTGDEEIPVVQEIESTAGGDTLFLIPGSSPNRWDVYALYGRGTPMRVADDADIPCPPIQGCQSVWGLYDLVVSADGGRMAFITTGFHVLEDDGLVHDVDHDEALTFSGDGWRYLTNDLPLGPILGYTSLSPDGSTVMLHGAVQETPSISTRRWLALASGAGPLRELAAQDFNLSAPAMNQDGTLALIDLSQLIATDGSLTLDLFPRWNVTAIALAANNDLAMTPDGRRVAFREASQSFRTGLLNDPAALETAPIAITDVSLSDGVLEVATTGPVHVLSLDGVQNGRLIPPDQAVPWRCTGPFRDDGQGPDARAEDGVFTVTCDRVTDADMTFRLGAATAGLGWVIVMDVPVTVLQQTVS